MLSLQGAAPDLARLQRMTEALRHRGPDDSGFLVDGAVGLGFRRLSILDLSQHGHQPMVAADGQVSMVFNGEIYNYLELRQQLIRLGHRFQSSGDSEVLLHAYLEWGRDCVDRLNGMWAFVIHDRRDGTLFGSRDRFGIKPLFRSNTPSAVLFASEIKGLLASGCVPARPHLETAAEYLLENRLDDSEQTFFEGILQVPAAHCFEVDRGGRYRQWRYWSIRPDAEAPPDPAQAFAELFEDAVRLHMRSDVPVAVHLSGGLDSTAIACASVRVRQAAQAEGRLAAFCYMDPLFDERRYIEDTLRQTGAEMVPLECTPRQLWDSLPQVLRAHDEPFHSMTALVGYQLMRRTAESGIKVVLNGQGADETLGGYGSYFSNYWHSLVRRAALGRLVRDLREWTDAHGRPLLPELLGVLRRHLLAGLHRLPPYRRASEERWRRRIERQRWVAPALRRCAKPPRYPRYDLDSALVWSVEHDPLPTYLRVEDRNSSAHSIEGRVPFLDHRLVSLAFSLPPEWRLRGAMNKYVLREAMRNRIPESVRARGDKMGFPVAATNWFRGELLDPVREVLNDPAFARTEGIDAAELRRMLAEHQSCQADHSMPILRAVQWHHWQRMLAA